MLRGNGVESCFSITEKHLPNSPLHSFFHSSARYRKPPPPPTSERETHLLPNTRSLPFDAAATAAALWAKSPAAAPEARKLDPVTAAVEPDRAAAAAAADVLDTVGVSSTELHGCTNHLPRRRTTSRDNKLRSIKLCSALKRRPRPSYDNPFSQEPWPWVPSANEKNGDKLVNVWHKDSQFIGSHICICV